MFDLKNIDFIKTDEERGFSNYSFVGIKRNIETDRLEFWLPLGFDDFVEDYDTTKSFFFKMYKTFKTYLLRRDTDMEEEEITRDRDGIIEQEGGFDFVNENKEQTIFYGKLNSLDKIIEGYDELKISSLEKKTQKSQEIDYSQIHKYMHQAVYLDGDVIYLDEMNIAKSVLIKDSHPILQLFSFIYSEIKKELGEHETLSDRVLDLSDLFKENYLSPNSSLFGEDTFGETLEILKDCLEEIELKTAYKDEDYWHFFEAVEAFLYGERDENENGIYWGFSSFYDIWEDLCQSYILNSEDYVERILFADLKGFLKDYKNREPNPFRMKLNNLTPSRYLRPDLVLNQTSELAYNSKEINRNGGQFVTVFFENFEAFKMEYPRSFQKYFELAIAEDVLTSIYYLRLEDHIKFLRIVNDHPSVRNFAHLFSPREIEVEGKTVYTLKFKNFHFFKTKYPDLHQVYQGLALRGKVKLDDRKFFYLTPEGYSDFEKTVQAEGNEIVEDKPTTIVDYKYMRLLDYQKYSPFYSDENGENKIKEDIHKQLIYEWTIQQNWNKKTESEFWIPFYSDEEDEFEKEESVTNPYFNNSKIKIKKINFKTLQNHYIEQLNL